MAEVDLELKRLFTDFQMKILETRSKVKQIENNIESLQRCSQKSNLTEMELKTIPETVNTYQSVGRLFYKSPRNNIMASLKEKVKSNQERIEKLEKERGYLENSLKESENNLREMISHKQGKS